MVRMGQSESMNSQVAKEVSMKALVTKALNKSTQAYDNYEEEVDIRIPKIVYFLSIFLTCALHHWFFFSLETLPHRGDEKARGSPGK